MASVKDVYSALDRWAPFAIQLGFDNAGFLVGRSDREVTRLLVALDITLPVAREAARLGAELVVAHHPVIFDPVKSITDADPVGRTLLELAEHKIAAICAHTNLDAAQGGVNDVLAQRLGLTQIGQLHQDGVLEDGSPYGIGRVGDAHQPMSPGDYASFVKDRLSAAGVRYVDTGRPVSRVAVGGGSCGSMLAQAAAAGCDAFVTADVKHDVFLTAQALGIALMDAGHYATENVICPVLADYLSGQFPQVQVMLSAIQRGPYAQV